MKTHTLADQLRQSAHVNRGIILPSGERTYRSWPLCLTCFKEVESCELKDVSETGCEIVAKCTHTKDGSGKVFEDFYKVNFGFRAEGDPLTDERANWAIKRAMADFCPFDPRHTLDTSKRRQ